MYFLEKYIASLFSPFSQFFDENGDPLSAGTLEFLKEGTTDTRQDTFSDSALQNPNTNPFVLDGEGRLPNLVFGAGVYNVILRSKATTVSPNGVLIGQLDPIGGDSGVKTAFDPYEDDVIYNEFDIVTVGDKNYQSLVDGNFDNSPLSNPGDNDFWEEFKLRGVYNAKIPYSIGEVIQSTVGNLWKSLTSSNLDNDPETNDGTNWIPAIDGSKIPEVITNTAKISEVLPQTVSGTLTAGGRVNQIRDSGAFTMPLANSVLADTILVVDLPSKFAAQTPTLTRSGSDLFEDKDGTDTVVNWIGAAKLTLTSNGSNRWDL